MNKHYVLEFDSHSKDVVTSMIQSISNHVNKHKDKTQFYLLHDLRLERVSTFGVHYKIDNYNVLSGYDDISNFKQRLDFENYLRKKSNVSHLPIYVVTFDYDWVCNHLDYSSQNIYIILLTDLEVFKRVYNFGEFSNFFKTLDAVSLKEESFLSSSEQESFVIHSTGLEIYNSSFTGEPLIKHCILPLNYYITVDELIYAVENNHLQYTDKEVINVVDGKNKTECLELLYSKKELIELIKS